MDFSPVHAFFFTRLRIRGAGIGIAFISTPMYVAEVTPVRIRGRMIAVNQIAVVGGLALTSFISCFIAKPSG